MKYCRNCGKELAEDAVLCTGCGCATDEYYTRPSANPKKSDEMSTMALLGFIFSFLNCLVGLILSCLAHKTAVAENDEKSRVFSKAGIIISAIALGLELFGGVIFGIIYGSVWLAMIGAGGLGGILA